MLLIGKIRLKNLQSNDLFSLTIIIMFSFLRVIVRVALLATTVFLPAVRDVDSNVSAVALATTVNRPEILKRRSSKAILLKVFMMFFFPHSYLFIYLLIFAF